MRSRRMELEGPSALDHVDRDEVDPHVVDGRNGYGGTTEQRDGYSAACEKPCRDPHFEQLCVRKSSDYAEVAQDEVVIGSVGRKDRI